MKTLKNLCFFVLSFCCAIYGSNWLEEEWEDAAGWPYNDGLEERFFELMDAWLELIEDEVEVDGLRYHLLKGGKNCRFAFEEMAASRISLNIPSSISYRGKKYTVTEIDNDYAFDWDEDFANVESISIPSTVTNILHAFYNLPHLASFSVGSESKYFKALDGVLYSADGKTLFQVPQAKTGTSFTVPSTVTELAGGAFCSTQFATITLPGGLTELRFETFNDCPKLQYLVIPDGVTVLRDCVFDSNNLALKYLVIGNGVSYIHPEFLAGGDNGVEQKLTIYTDNSYVKRWFQAKSSSQFIIKPRSEAPGYVPPAPVVPQPTATADQSDGVTVSWAAVSGASKYKVRRGTTSTYSKSTLLATVTSTSCNDTSAAVGTAYYYWVVPVDSAGKEYYDAAKYATGRRVKAPTILTPPSPTSSTAIVVNWAAVPNAVSYRIRRSASPEYSASEEVGVVSAPPFIDAEASPDIPHYYWVLPENDSGIAYHDESKFTSGIRIQNPATSTIALKRGWNLCPVSAARLGENSRKELLGRFRVFQYDQSRHAYIRGALEGYDSFWLYAEEPETLVLEIADLAP